MFPSFSPRRALAGHGAFTCRAGWKPWSTMATFGFNVGARHRRHPRRSCLLFRGRSASGHGRFAPNAGRRATSGDPAGHVTFGYEAGDRFWSGPGDPVIGTVRSADRGA